MTILTNIPEESNGSTTLPEPARAAGRRRVSLSLINLGVDVLLLLILIVLGWVSATLQVAFPAPTAATGWSLWGLSYDQWRDVQFATLCVLALVVLVHLMLHWNWICSVIANQVLHTKQRPDSGMQTIYGVATLIGILHVIGAAVLAAMLCVHRPPL
jgi:hypothetical protein